KNLKADLSLGIGLLSEVLWNPLYPQSWESAWFARLRKLLVFYEADRFFKKAEAPSELPIPATEPQFPEKLRVLVVEDDEDIRQLLDELIVRKLSTTEYESKLAANFKEAIHELRTGLYDAVILDIALDNDELS